MGTEGRRHSRSSRDESLFKKRQMSAVFLEQAKKRHPSPHKPILLHAFHPSRVTRATSLAPRNDFRLTTSERGTSIKKAMVLEEGRWSGMRDASICRQRNISRVHPCLFDSSGSSFWLFLPTSSIFNSRNFMDQGSDARHSGVTSVRVCLARRRQNHLGGVVTEDFKAASRGAVPQEWLSQVEMAAQSGDDEHRRRLTHLYPACIHSRLSIN